MKNLKDYLNESIIDSIKDKLSPELWTNEKMKPSAKSFIVNKLQMGIIYLELRIQSITIFLTK